MLYFAFAWLSHLLLLVGSRAIALTLHLLLLVSNCCSSSRERQGRKDIKPQRPKTSNKGTQSLKVCMGESGRNSGKTGGEREEQRQNLALLGFAALCIALLGFALICFFCAHGRKIRSTVRIRWHGPTRRLCAGYAALHTAVQAASDEDAAAEPGCAALA